MKTNAAEYFSSLSPLKAADTSRGSSAYESHVQNGRSGRCHCCPYGYHIDLDFVRYCDNITQGSKNDSPTLRHLKKLKRARRRQTKSMEVLLGLSPGKENEAPDQHPQTWLEVIEEPRKRDALRETSSIARRSQSLRERTPPPPPPRRCRTPLMSPPPDVINTTNSSSAFNSSSNADASEALQEAVLDFEEMLENSREKQKYRGRADTMPHNVPSLDLLHHTPPPQNHSFSHKTGASVTRSHSLPRQLPEDSPLLSRHHYANSNSSLSSLCSTPGNQGQPPSSHLTMGGYGLTSGTSLNNGLAMPGNVGIIQQHMPSSHLSETLAALNAARGYSAMHQDFDTMSVTSAMSGVSTSTLQSIRDQMATSLTRLKELEEEVKTIPKLQIKLDLMKEERRFLLQQLKSIRKGDDVLLPPGLDGDLTDLSEDELEGRLASLKHRRGSRRRSESPMRVNLEEFRSYRRARRGSVSEGSECESVRSAVDETPLFIKEVHDHSERRLSYDTSMERRQTLEQATEKRSQSATTTPVVPRKIMRDASTSCRVVTRDIGVSHVGARTRSVGLTTDRVELDRKKEIKAKPCMQCYERNRKTFESKGVGTPAEPHTDKHRRLSMSSVSLESVEPDDIDADHREPFEKEGSPKNTFLQKLGRKSAIISRLSEPQLAPPVLTFDNSTNTDRVHTRDQRLNTSISMKDLFSREELNQHLAEAEMKWKAQERRLRDLQKPLMVDSGVQVTVKEEVTKTKFQPLKQSVGIMVKPAMVDTGVGLARISDVLCDKCSNVKKRSVGSGDGMTIDLICDKCSIKKTRSVGVGDYKLSDTMCVKCSQVQTKSVGSSNDRITDRICNRCDNLHTRSVATGTMSLTESKIRTSNTYVQTAKPDTRTTGVNTQPINLKKEELSLDSCATPPSPALTPEVERRSFGSAGVRICDKCHETIHSVAKDIVNTSGTASATNLPPLPPQTSKIPRLVDISKVEPRLDPPRQEIKNVSNLTSLGSSRSETQISSLSSSFTESKPSSLRTRSLTRSDSASPKPTKLGQVGSTANETSPLKYGDSSSLKPSQSQIATLASRGRTKSDLGPSTVKESLPVKTSPKVEKPSVSQEKQVTKSSKSASSAVSITTTDTTSSGSATQSKRAPYMRQDTYTKFSEGLVNLGFDESADTAEAKRQKEESKVKESPARSLPSVAENNNITPKKDAKLEKQEKEVEKKKEESPTKPKEPEPVIQGRKEGEKSSTSSSESDNETADEESLLGASFSSRLEDQAVNSSFQSTSSIFTTASQKSRRKSVPSREMKAALKVLNDSIGKPVRSGQQLTNALNIIQRDWFKMSSQKDADPHGVEDYMDVFEDYSKSLLQRVVNLSDVNGNTAMHYAVSHGNFDVVSVLLDSKVCNINQQNKAGYTAIMLVSLAQIRSDTHSCVVKRLFQLGDVNIKASQHGQTALMLAVSHGRLDMVRLLVMAGAEINIQDEDGSTGLMCAAEHGHLAIVKFLLNQPDTDPTLMDNDGSTALTIAVEAGHKDVGVLLYKHMNLSRGSSPYSSIRIKRSRTPTMSRSSVTPPPRSSAPSSPGRSRKSSAPHSPGRSRQSSASLSNLMI